MRRALALGLAVLLAGCAGGARYADLPEKNLTVHTRVSGATAALGVHAVDAQCKPSYEGTVGLDESVTQVGLPVSRWSYLVFEFATSSFWSGRRGSITQETLLRPAPGARYEARVSYQEGLYQVALREIPARGRPRELPLAGIGRCRP